MTKSVVAVDTHIMSAQSDVQNPNSESVISIIETVTSRKDMAVGDERPATSKFVSASFILKEEVDHPRKLIGRHLVGSSRDP